MVASPKELGPEIDCAGEDQQQFNRPTDSEVSRELTAKVWGVAVGSKFIQPGS
jgi:hypothetical protein